MVKPSAWFFSSKKLQKPGTPYSERATTRVKRIKEKNGGKTAAFMLIAQRALTSSFIFSSWGHRFGSWTLNRHDGFGA